MKVFFKSAAAGMLIALLFLPASFSAPAGAREAATAPVLGWEPSAAGGFLAGSANFVATPIVEYKEKLYAGAANQGGAQVWVKNGAVWTRATGTLWSAGDNAILRMLEFDGKLYAGTLNLEDGCGLYSFDGTSWTDVLKSPGGPGAGFGNKYNLAVTAMEVFENELYVGLTNYVLDRLSEFPPQLYTEGVKMWKFDGEHWTELDTSDITDQQRNAGVGAFEVYGGRLYASTIRFEYGFSVLQLSPLRIQIDIKPRGCQLYRTSGAAGGYRWTMVADNGFTDTRNLAAVSMLEHQGRLYIGTTNGTAGIVYNVDTSRMEDFIFESDGLCVYSYDGSRVRTVASGGFGESDTLSAVSMESLSLYGESWLLVGTASASGSGTLMCYDGTSWSALSADGFGSPGNGAVTSLAVIDEGSGEVVYAGTQNEETGCEVWRSTPYTTWYLAEGSSDWGYDTYINFLNPNDRQVRVRVTYMTKDGPKTRPDITLAASSQTTINPRDDLGATDFSTRVQCLDRYRNVYVDRRMLWTGRGALSQEGHSSIGVPAPARAWYLAEGSSKWGFETWLMIQNPNDREAECTVTYMVEGSGPRVLQKKVPANSRATYSMFEDIGEADSSIKVESLLPVIPERAMYRNDRRGGHDSIGTTTPAREFFLAEGTTDWGFTTYIVVQNPNDEDNTVSITYMTPQGQEQKASHSMPPNSRWTVRANFDVPNRDISTRVSGTLPLIAERAMYWDAGLGEACHDSIGMSAPHSRFYLPDGETNGGYETWTLVQNPNPVDVTIRVSYLRTGGAENVSFQDTVPAGCRRTYDMARKLPAARASVVVECLTPNRRIMVERAMYWNNRGAGTSTLGGYSD